MIDLPVVKVSGPPYDRKVDVNDVRIDGVRRLDVEFDEFGCSTVTITFQCELRATGEA